MHNTDTLISTDKKNRLLALNPQESFIVQAPAGSGKTELLTQRFLSLLSQAVEDPENIIAITFTKKSAAEMRRRIVDALDQASDPQPTEPHKLITWELAQKVQQQNIRYNWGLNKNPNRLRIMTIDALNASLCQQMPVLSQGGTPPGITHHAASLYETATQEFLTSLSNTSTPWHNALQSLCLLYDNRMMRLTQVLVEALSTRDQWMPTVIPHHHDPEQLRTQLEDHLLNLVTTECQRLIAVIDADWLTTMNHLVDSLLPRLQEEQPDHTFCQRALTIDNTPNNLARLQIIAGLLLTDKGTWRRTINKRQGLYPDQKELKALWHTQRDIAADHPQWRLLLEHITKLPPTHYTESQWSAISTLMRVLPWLLAHLTTVCQRERAIDFIDMSQGALRALGTDDQPTDLQLYMDHRIRHILIDECQDTSAAQWDLLKKLTAQWTPHDGRTLFLVGDPMQSIYRFRKADVSLFITAQQSGIGHLPLTPLTLYCNFRSCQHLVDWTNHTFQAVLPKQDDCAMGAIQHSPSIGMTPAIPHDPVITRWAAPNDTQDPAIITEIKQITEQHPDDEIAILVRSRHHIGTLTEQLDAHSIPYALTEMNTLIDQPIVQDLLSLLQAIQHLEHRAAWLAILRAPWCGLLLKDLYQVSQQRHTSIWSALHTTDTLSKDGQRRVTTFINALTPHLYNPQQESTSVWLHRIWHALRGPSHVTSVARHHAEQFLQIVDQCPSQGSTVVLKQRLSKQAINYVQDKLTHITIMTIHKSKGLEFDHVIIPGFSARAAHDHPPLLALLETQHDDHAGLIMAPQRTDDRDTDHMSQYIQWVNQQKQQHEARRLLYVAATRAKKSLHFIGHERFKDGDRMTPHKGSFAYMLWDHLSHTTIQHTEPADQTSQATDRACLSRYTLNSLELINTEIITPLLTAEPHPPTSPTHRYERTVGTLMHQLLDQMTRSPHTLNDKHWAHYIEQAVLRTPLNTTDQQSAMTLLQHTRQQLIHDKRAQWILQAHTQAHSEHPVSTIIQGRIQHLVIDRTFVDEQNRRWIVDYKMIFQNPAKEDDWQRITETYRPQLEGYARLFDHPEIFLGLYFPIQQHWIEWCVTPSSIPF